MSLDACVVAGSAFVSFFLSLSFLPPRPPPSFLARGVCTSKLGFCNRFLNEVWTVIGLSPFIWFPFHRPHRRLSFFSFMSFCLHYRPDLSLYTYTHAYSTYNVCYDEVWFIGCPSSLGSSSSATTHTFCRSRSFHFHLSILRAHGPCLLSGKDGDHTCLPSGRRVCVCNPWNQRNL